MREVKKERGRERRKKKAKRYVIEEREREGISELYEKLRNGINLAQFIIYTLFNVP